MSRTEEEEQLVRLAAALDEYTILDERVPREVLLRLIRDAVVKPLDEQPLILQTHIEGTTMYRLWRKRSCDLTPEEQALMDTMDDFRTLSDCGE